MDPKRHGPKIRARLGLVPQEDSLELELSAMDNLIMYGRYFDLPRAEITRRALNLLEFTQLSERANDKADNFSGGMKRRLTIARSLISEPDVLILDEPTTGLDPQARHLVWERLYRLKSEGVTLVITTHYMDEAEQLCDRLVVMDRGKIVAHGTPRELIERALDARGARAALRAQRPRPARRGRRRPRRPRRGAPGPPLALRPRRRRGARRGPRERASRPRARSCGAPRSRTSSCGSPVGRWWTDVTTTREPITARGAAQPTVGWAPWRRALWYHAAFWARTWRGQVFSSFLFPILYLAVDGPRRRQARQRARRHRPGRALPRLRRAGAARDERRCRSRRTSRCGRSSRRSSGRAATGPRSRRPSRPRDLVAAKLTWVAIHVAMVGVIYTTVLAAFGVLHSPLAVLLPLAAALTGLAYAAPIAAYCATQENPQLVHRLLPARHHPHVLVLGLLLPDQPAAGMAADRRAVRAAVPRRRALPDPGARPGHARS